MAAAQASGANLIAGRASSAGTTTYRAVNPRTGEEVGPVFSEATDAEVATAAEVAGQAFSSAQDLPPDTLAALLERIAAGLEELGDHLIETADAETALGSARLSGERARTCGQLRAFAEVVLDGAHLDVRIDHADPGAQPPRPDLRRMRLPVGPVAVFGASNFPLAFSVPGGDTASALAAGCPVLVKAHPSHPVTSELCGRVIAQAVDELDLPAGMFSLLHGSGPEVGRALVLAPQVKAVGFTGSTAGGRALFDLGSGRPDPIPVYAEMGSLNPVFVSPRALERRAREIAEGFVGSFTLGTGQFCTKPGLLFLPDAPGARTFEEEVAERVGRTPAGPLLNERIHAGLRSQLADTLGLAGVEVLAGRPQADGEGFVAGPLVLATDADTFLRTPELAEEHFGPVSVLVRCASVEQMRQVAERVEGSLTATLHAEADEGEEVAALQRTLRGRAGRIVWNQFPTGVAVTHAMHHGGPYPATTSAAYTSVGSAAIERFLRPVTYQNAPEHLLPAALRDDNPLGIPRLVDGRREGVNFSSPRSM